MKPFYLIILLLTITSLTGFAQRFEGGALIGLNASQVDGDNYSGYHKPGVALGGFVQTNLSRTIYAGMELKLMQKGSRNIDSLALTGRSNTSCDSTMLTFLFIWEFEPAKEYLFWLVCRQAI